MSTTRATAFVSWAHAGRSWTAEQSEVWRSTVHRFTDLLRNSGVDADVDLYHHHEQGIDWNRFGPTRIRECDYTIAAVSAAWIRRFDGTEEATVGAGAAREADALLSIFQRDRADFARKLMLVFLPGADTRDVPDTLHGIQRFTVSDLTAAGIEDLLRTLHRQPRYRPPILGEIPRLPPAESPAVATSQGNDRDLRSIKYSSVFSAPPNNQVPGWITEPWLRLRVASYITPVTAAETSPLKAAVRTKILEALNDLDLNLSLRRLASQLTPLTAVRDGRPVGPPSAMDAWRVNTDAHINSDHAMMRLGGDASSGATANVSFSLPGFTGAGQASIKIDVGLSFTERISVRALADLVRDGLAALPALRSSLNEVMPSSARLSTTGITLVAPQSVGVAFRENSTQQRIEFSAMGPLTRPVQGDIGVSFDLPDWYEAANAAEVAYGAFDHMMTDIGALDPDAGLAELADRLGVHGIV